MPMNRMQYVDSDSLVRWTVTVRLPFRFLQRLRGLHQKVALFALTDWILRINISAAPSMLLMPNVLCLGPAPFKMV